MFMEEPSPRAPWSVSATPSLACDLSWLLHVAARPTMQARYPQLAEMFTGREDLADRVRRFWGDGPEECSFTEMQVLAHHGGALTTTDPEALWTAIERAVATVPLDLDLPSESPEERATYLERFRLLKEAPTLVASYRELLRDVWAPVNDMWQQALPLLEEAGRLAVAQFERDRALDTVVTRGCDILQARVPSLPGDLASGRVELLFVPCLFFGSSMYLEFDGLVVIGAGAGHNDAPARARTESVARRLKAMADPTRLAILHSLATAPSTVGELAVLFRLAQPTVSMHVKVLRQNGLVRSERRAGRLRLSADPAAVETLLGELREAVLRGGQPTSLPHAASSTTGSDRMPATVVESTRSAGPVTA
jgi:ArsR family transcriptional regulator, cadmium/lead-responsive transcriptional repressor